MSLQRRAKYLENVEELELWMKTNGHLSEAVMPQEMADHLERLQLAYRWLLENDNSKRKVWPMLLVHYKKIGLRYSEAMARKDVNDAQALFRTANRTTARFICEFQIDAIQERMGHCKRHGKDREFAMLAATLDRYLERLDKYVAEDALMKTDPVPVRMVFDLQEAGIEPEPNLAAKIKAWKEKRARLVGNGYEQAEDATYTELDGDNDQ